MSSGTPEDGGFRADAGILAENGGPVLTDAQFKKELLRQLDATQWTRYVWKQCSQVVNNGPAMTENVNGSTKSSLSSTHNHTNSITLEAIINAVGEDAFAAVPESTIAWIEAQLDMQQHAAQLAAENEHKQRQQQKQRVTESAAEVENQHAKNNISNG